MIGTDQSLVERHSIWSRLIDLAKTHNNQLSSIDFSLASSLFVAALPADQVTAKTLETERLERISTLIRTHSTQQKIVKRQLPMMTTRPTKNMILTKNLKIGEGVRRWRTEVGGLKYLLIKACEYVTGSTTKDVTKELLKLMSLCEKVP